MTATVESFARMAGVRAAAVQPWKGGGLGGGASFGAVLNGTARGFAGDDQKHAEARKAAAGLVSNALILPVLKQVRRSPWGQNSVFSGGNGEKVFGPEFDQVVADQIAQSPRMAVTQVLTARLEKTGKSPVNAATALKAASGKLDLHG